MLLADEGIKGSRFRQLTFEVVQELLVVIHVERESRRVAVGYFLCLLFDSEWDTPKDAPLFCWGTLPLRGFIHRDLYSQ